MSEEISNTKGAAVQTNSQNAANRKVGSFFYRHRLLIIGIILYIVVYFISNKYPAWVDRELLARDNRTWVRNFQREYASGGFMKLYFSDLFPEKSLLSKLPFDILYYGIADIAAAVHFEAYAALGIAAYGMLFLNKGMKRLGNEENPVLERYINDYLYSNIVCYPLSLIMSYSAPYLTTYSFSSGNPGDNMLLFILNTLLLCFSGLFLILPAGVYSLFFLLYFLLFKFFRNMVFGIQDLVGDDTLIQNIIMTAITVILILGYNMAVERLMKKCLKFIMSVEKLIFDKIRNIFRFGKRRADSK